MKKSRIIEILILITLAAAVFFTVHRIYYNKFVKPNLYTIRFQDADSLIKGSPVRFMGIIVGHVRNLKQGMDSILCEIIITKPNTKIPDGAIAKVEYNGLGGSKSIEIMPPKTDTPGTKGIIVSEALRISDYMEAFSNVREVLVCIKQFVDGITPQSTLDAAKAISQAPDFTEDINKTLDKAAKNQEKLRNVNKFEHKIEKFIDSLKFW